MSDLISRQALCEYALNQKDKSVTPNDIMRFPSAQPERKKGKWTTEAACSLCGFQPWYERDIHTLNYCPNCGADMRRERTMEMTLTLNNPLTEEEWDMLTDVDMDNTPAVTFHTKHGKTVEYVKVVRCKDCQWYGELGCAIRIVDDSDKPGDNDYCSFGERRENDGKST